jgi:hypothetical protein
MKFRKASDLRNIAKRRFISCVEVGTEIGWVTIYCTLVTWNVAGPPRLHLLLSISTKGRQPRDPHIPESIFEDGLALIVYGQTNSRSTDVERTWESGGDPLCRLISHPFANWGHS